MDNILGVKIDNLSRKEILSRVESFLLDENFHQIATVNPEFILQAQEDAEFKEILNGCDLNVADGTGVWFAYLRFGKLLKCRMTGIDLMVEVLRIANRKNMKVFLATKEGGLSNFKEIKDAILKTHPNLEIEGNDISSCDIVFSALGSPVQEKFLNSLKNDKIKLAMGIGGSFDYLTKKIIRAPRWMRRIGLEWVFRLILEPRYRFKRIFNAVIIFPIKIILNKK